MGGCKIMKFVKVFSLESFPLYGITVTFTDLRGSSNLIVAAKWNMTDTFSASRSRSDSPIPNPGSPQSPLIGTTFSRAEGLSERIKSNN